MCVFVLVECMLSYVHLINYWGVFGMCEIHVDISGCILRCLFGIKCSATR